ncbi:Initiation-specific alpha-1,6-mannosyltransferase [Colletotrichum spinosum]|uniref:Initiation-specific alpha-1,6-mannosyltransferase n=1 Tax=Colletotrichum spinosum TaxID=1347390 RepID=A0A4R8QRE1_9PEZI|nr:Initiation-specific alpha-1,6-mannosyltransferase [Colletotrichum spinosum]
MLYAHPQKPPSSPIWAQPLTLQPPTPRFRTRTLVALVLFAVLTIVWASGHHHVPLRFNLRHGGAVLPEEWRTNVTQLIPPKIWQIILPKKAPESDKDMVIDPAALKESQSWIALNPGYSYTMMGEKSGLEYVQQHFADEPELLAAYVNMPNVGMKSDFLRYLVLGLEGGVYTDTDTLALKPIDAWVPAEYRDKARLVVGVEFDRRDGDGWRDILHWVQFCQWTIAAAPGHPVFGKMAARILRSLAEMAATHEADIKDVRPSSVEVMNSTGPAAWTETVFLQLQEYDNSLTDIKNLSYITEPRLIGDVLILPIDGFGMDQPHSNSTRGDPPEAALMKHLFHGSWRGD